MATSGSTDFTLNRDQILAVCLRNLRRIDPALSTPSIDVTTGAIKMNLLLKSLQADGIFLWLNQECVLHLQYNTQSYSLGATGDNFAALSDCVKTQLAADVAALGTSLTVDSITGIASADYIGVELDDGTIHWDTVDGAPSGTTVTLTTGVASSASTDNYVFTYTTKIARPTSIIECRVRDVDNVDRAVKICTERQEFFGITDKTSQGETLEVYYHPGVGNGTLYTWPVAGTSDITDRLVMTCQRVIEDFDASANTADLPGDALLSFIDILTYKLAPEYGVSTNTGKGIQIKEDASIAYERLRRAYGSQEPVYLRP